MFGYVFAAKVGCGITAELGAAKVNEELDAYESEAVDPYHYVVGTRIAGALIYIPIAAAVALIGGFLGGYLNAVVVLQGLSAAGFTSVNWASQSLVDQLNLFVTAATIGVTIVVVACFYGYRAEGGPAGVGDAVARSVVVNLVLLHVIAAFFAIVFYGTDPRLPFGG
jgi:phospholipid/cholesterol/gamma-HCH transport system permease protein